MTKMRIVPVLLILGLSMILSPVGLGQQSDSGRSAPKSEASGKSEQTETQKDPFDFSDSKKAGSNRDKDDYLVLDESIKVKVEPVERSAVVDRVIGRSTTIYVTAPQAVRVQVYLEPVDSPYCGKALAPPRLIGQSSDFRRNFPVVWSSPEPYRYVKIFARAFKADGYTAGRSRSVDLALAGLRYAPQPDTPGR